MMGARMILSAIVLLLCYGAVAPEQGIRARRTLVAPSFSNEQIQAIVDRHNALRKTVEPSSSNMQQMVWHEHLAMMAQTWANKCTMEHGMPEKDGKEEYTEIGQNMKMGVGLTVLDAINEWFSEKEFYNYDTMMCDTDKKCIHYTQVVWAESKDIGCGVAECNSTARGVHNMVFCNYGPAGNTGHHDKPYKSGDPCTSCPSPNWCYQGLCMPGCASHSAHSSECECHIKHFTCENSGDKNKETCSCDCKDGFSGDYCADAVNPAETPSAATMVYYSVINILASIAMAIAYINL